MVNLGKLNISEFIKSGAVLRDSDGSYWLAQNLKLADSTTALKFWVQTDFFSAPQAWTGEEIFKVSSKEFLKILGRSESKVPELVLKNDFRPIFEEFFETAKRAIKSSEIRKIVPYSLKEFHGTVDDEAKIYFLSKLIKFSEKSASHLYGFWRQNFGFMGSTPEILFKKDDHKIETMALAGSRPVKSESTELLEDPKERLEHQLVIDSLKESLKYYGQVDVQATTVKKLPHILHLETKISVEKVLQKSSYEGLVFQLHPTPALGGYPKIACDSHLRSFDQRLPRGNFGATFGFEDDEGNGFSVVMIRGARWNQNGLTIGAGCGVVEASRLDREWSEVCLKTAAVEKAMGITHV